MKISAKPMVTVTTGLLLAMASATQAQAVPQDMAPPAATPTPAPSPAALPNPKIGGVDMDETKTIVDNAAKAPNLTTLVSAVQAADLAATLSGPGPFTLFAPTNDAFGRLAPGTMDTLLKPENKETLTKVLNYHVVPGKITLADLRKQMEAGGGTATLTTVEGETLSVTDLNGAIELTDIHGNKSYVQAADVRQSNGIVHVVNGVLIPTLN